MQKENIYSKKGEIGFLDRSYKLLEIILEEYIYKLSDTMTNRFSIPRGRFESDGIYLDDIEFCLDKFVNINKDSRIISLDNNFILKSNIKFRSICTGNLRDDAELKAIYESNQLKYSELFEFTLYPGYSYQDIQNISDNLFKILSKKKVDTSKNIEDFLYFNQRVLFINFYDPSYSTQIDFSRKKYRSPDKMYYFISSFISIVRIVGSFKGSIIEAEIPKKLLIEQIQKDHNVLFSDTNISDTKRNFVHTKISEKLETKFIISDYQKSTKSYNFKLILN